MSLRLCSHTGRGVAGSHVEYWPAGQESILQPAGQRQTELHPLVLPPPPPPPSLPPKTGNLPRLSQAEIPVPPPPAPRTGSSRHVIARSSRRLPAACQY